MEMERERLTEAQDVWMKSNLESLTLPPQALTAVTT